MLNRLAVAEKLNPLKLQEIIDELKLYLKPVQYDANVYTQVTQLINLLNHPTILLSNKINEQKTILLISLLFKRINAALRHFDMSDSYTNLKKILGIYVTDLEILDYLQNQENVNQLDKFMQESLTLANNIRPQAIQNDSHREAPPLPPRPGYRR